MLQAGDLDELPPWVAAGPSDDDLVAALARPVLPRDPDPPADDSETAAVRDL